MKKVCKIVTIFLIILSLYSVMFNTYAAESLCGCDKWYMTVYYPSTMQLEYICCTEADPECSESCPNCEGQCIIKKDPIKKDPIEEPSTDWKDQGIWDIGNSFLNIGAYEDRDVFNSNATFEDFRYITDFIWGLGLLIVFISTIVLGIKYMLVNPNEKSRVKQATTPYIIGVVIIFGAVTIWKLLIDILEGSMLGR